MQSIGLTLLRTGLGLSMLLAHGLPKLMAFTSLSMYFPDPLGVGSTLSLSLVIFAEVICSILLITGIGVRFACLPLIITMLVATLIIHAEDPFSKKELAMMYTIGYTSLLIGGRGAFSINLDHLFPNKPWLNWLIDRQC